MSKIALAEIAERVGGRVIGDETLLVESFAPFEQAGEGDITFITNPKYLKQLAKTRATAVIVNQEVAAPCALVVCANPYLAFARVLEQLYVKPLEPRGIMPGAQVHPAAQIGERVTIHPGCHIGENVRIGDDTTLYPNVVIYPDVRIGQNCQLHAGVVIREDCVLGDRVILQPSVVVGSDGFGFAPDGDRYVKIPQVGNVEIGDDVEIGAGACIDRAALGTTRIENGCKLDNMVHIAHNVTVGENTVMAAQVGIAGSTVIGRHCTFGGQAAAAGHVRIGNNVTVGGKSAIASHTEGDQVLSGIPAMPHRDWLKASMSLVKLPQMRQGLSVLKKRVEELENRLKEE